MQYRIEYKTWNHKTRRKQGKLLDTGFGNDFLDLTPKAKATKERINNIEVGTTSRGTISN